MTLFYPSYRRMRYYNIKDRVNCHLWRSKYDAKFCSRIIYASSNYE